MDEVNDHGKPYNLWAAQAVLKACVESETRENRERARAELLRTLESFQPHLNNLDENAIPQALAILDQHIARVDAGWRREPR